MQQMTSREQEQWLRAQVVKALGASWSAATLAPAGISCIGKTWVIDSGSARLFLKGYSNVDGLARQRLQAETEGLDLLRQCQCLRIPEIRFHCFDRVSALLGLELIEFGRMDEVAAVRLGRALAELHSIEAESYGLGSSNFIGSTWQLNTPCSRWSDFFVQSRLEPQLRLARLKGLSGRLQRLLEAALIAARHTLEGHQPAPSLLHGDLWRGNVGVDEKGRPVLYDPAVYYGDSEVDLAMSRMFGALPAATYHAYAEQRSPQPGWQERARVYDLYHWLNHYFLFGLSYLASAEVAAEAVLADEGVGSSADG